MSEPKHKVHYPRGGGRHKNHWIALCGYQWLSPHVLMTTMQYIWRAAPEELRCKRCAKLLKKISEADTKTQE